VPVDGLTIDATYGYLDAEFDEYMALNPATNRLEDISDNTTVAQAPENTAERSGVQYDFEPFSFGALSARLDVAYKDEFVFHPFQNLYDGRRGHAGERPHQPERHRSGLGCAAKGEPLRVSLWGKNLGPTRSTATGSASTSSGSRPSLGFAGNVYGEPRTYGLDVAPSLATASSRAESSAASPADMRSSAALVEP
jgi:iron complex outermembrane receptor protein